MSALPRSRQLIPQDISLQLQPAACWNLWFQVRVTITVPDNFVTRPLSQRPPRNTHDSRKECSDRWLHFSLVHCGWNRRHDHVQPGDRWSRGRSQAHKHYATSAPDANDNRDPGLLQAACALVLAVTLYAITRGEDPEGQCSPRPSASVRACWPPFQSAPLWDCSGSRRRPGQRRRHSATLLALGTYFLNGPNSNVSAIFFAIGSLLFSYLLLRGRIIPVLLAWLGVVASGSSSGWTSFATCRICLRVNHIIPMDSDGRI